LEEGGEVEVVESEEGGGGAGDEDAGLVDGVVGWVEGAVADGVSYGQSLSFQGIISESWRVITPESWLETHILVQLGECGLEKTYCLKGVEARGKRRVGETPWFMVYSAM